jgi:hypothetical protein
MTLKIKAIFTLEGNGKIALPATVDFSHNKQFKAMFRIRTLIGSGFSWACGSGSGSRVAKMVPFPEKKCKKISYLKLSKGMYRRLS